MRDKLDERLREVKTRMRSKRKLESMLQQVEATLGDEQAKYTVLAERLAAEKADVEKLGGLSLTGLFYSVLGTKEERVEQERQEVLAAKLKHQEAAASLEDARREVQRIRDQLAPLATLAADYEQLIGEKEQLLAQGGDERAKTLLDFAEQLAELDADRRELEEAIDAGAAAQRSLRLVSEELASAANWGTWDMIGGGMISTMAKHSKIDSAKELARLAQQRLRRFQEELADAGQRLHLSLQIDGFSKFADYFFDGLIADWVVQSKIRAASDACASTTARVSSAVSQCRRRLTETQQALAELTSHRREFIEQA